MSVVEWAKNCTPKEFVLEGYWRLTDPHGNKCELNCITPEQIRDALQEITNRVTAEGVDCKGPLGRAYKFVFGHNDMWEAVGSLSLHAQAAERAKEFKG